MHKERSPSVCWREWWVGHRTILDVLAKRKISHWESDPGQSFHMLEQWDGMAILNEWGRKADRKVTYIDIYQENNLQDPYLNWWYILNPLWMMIICKMETWRTDYCGSCRWWSHEGIRLVFNVTFLCNMKFVVPACNVDILVFVSHCF
jgi:hypothetical protein